MAADVDFGVQVTPVQSRMAQLNRTSSRALTKFERDAIAKSSPIYIYNVSPIHHWDRPQGQLGTLRIHARKEGEVVSQPTVVPGVVTRRYDRGFGRREPFQESGMEVAMDVCGCHPEYPAESSANNLTNFGVFITEKPFEDYKPAEQNAFIDKASAKLVERLRTMILEADNWWQGVPAPVYKGLIGDIHRKALAALNDLTGAKEDRPWAPVRGTKITEDCRFCGSAVKPGIVVCPTCSNVLDIERYEEMQGRKVKGGKKND